MNKDRDKHLKAMSKSKREQPLTDAKPAGKRIRKALLDPVPATEAVVVGLMRAGRALESRLDKLFAGFGLTLLQYNALRILYVRDAEQTGIPTGTIGSMMVNLVPDVSRLLDRLVSAGHIERTPSPEDRRVVLVKLTQQGYDLVESLHPTLLAHNANMLDHMTTAELENLAKGLAHAMEGGLSRRE
jgi:DNA-binding MarR family transcriptional regulator